MKYRFLLCLLTITVYPLAAMETEEAPAENKDEVTLISSEGRSFVVARDVAFLSKKIKDFSSKDEGFYSLSIKAETLEIIITVLEQIQLHIRNYKTFGSDVVLLQRPDGGFIAKNLQPIVDAVIVDQGIDDIKNFINGCIFLEMPFLVNVGAKLYMKKTVAMKSSWSNPGWKLSILWRKSLKAPMVLWEELEGDIREREFHSDAILYLKKHCCLEAAGIQEELTVADYMALKGIEINREGKVILREIGITSLSGIETMQNPETITSLDLSRNMILGQAVDPDFPLEPFKKMKVLQFLFLENNSELRSLPYNVFAGLNDLKGLDVRGNRLGMSKEDFRRTYKLPEEDTPSPKFALLFE